MKLKLKKKTIKQLSQVGKNKKVLPAKLTRRIAGAGYSEMCMESDPVFCGGNQL